MKKYYKLTLHYEDEEEVDSLSEVLEEMYISDEEGVWLDTGEITILLPAEMAKCIERTGILGMA